jgi:hypothetical protein
MTQAAIKQMTPLQEAINAAKKFETIKEFRLAHSAFYYRIAKHNAYDVAFSHMRRIRVTQEMYENGRHCTACKIKQPIKNFLLTGKNQTRRRSICLDCHNKKCADWRFKNPEKSRQIVSKSAKAYPEKMRARSAYKRKMDPHGYAARYMLKRVLKLTGKRKNTKTETAMGYTKQELKDYISAQFLSGMSWDNWGEWHIDHKKPVAQFIREGETRPEIINALENLQPLWAYDNLSKIWEARIDNRNNKPSA